MELRFIIIKVKNLERAKKFYNKILNKKPTKEEGNRMIEYKTSNIKIGLYNPEADQTQKTENIKYGDNIIPAFGTKNLKEELKRVKNITKIKKHRKIKGHEWFTFEDPEGNTIEIHKK